VRAREAHDLQNIMSLADLNVSIERNTGTDYEYRIILKAHGEVFDLLEVLGRGVDYPNFKDAVHDAPDQGAKLKPYFDIWLTMVKAFSKWGRNDSI